MAFNQLPGGMVLPSAIAVASEVAGSATALAGLILVFLGAISASFSSYDKQGQSAVRGRFQWRAWFAFVGFVLCLLAASFALLGKWLSNDCAAFAGLVLLVVALVWVLLAALAAVREIK